MLLTVALAGPTADAKEPRNRATVMLAIDVSLSMEATDVAPNRLAAAQEAADAVRRRPDPGGQPRHRLLRRDRHRAGQPDHRSGRSAKQAIAGLKLDERTATGEAIISSLQTIELFSKSLPGPTDGSDPAAPPARIVLMTDGKRTVGRTEQDAAQRAADAKVPVSVIAFGTDNGSIVVNDETIPVPLDTEAMQQIAQISGGDFHTAATTEELKSVYAQLGEQIGYEIKQRDVSRPWMIAGTVAGHPRLRGRAGADLPHPLTPGSSRSGSGLTPVPLR